jgi:hypothetical protein
VSGTWQFSASVAPLDSRSKTIKPLRRQGFFVCGTPVLSECRTTDFPLQIQKNPATSGVFCVWYVTIALLAQQFSASVAPLDSRSKTIKPLQRQGFLFLLRDYSFIGTPVLSERRTAGFPRQNR